MPLDVATTNAIVGNAYASAYARASAAVSSQPNKPKNRFVYPIKRIEATSDYLEIKIFDYRPATPGFNITNEGNFTIPNFSYSFQNSQQVPKFYIHLPIPQSITDSNSVTWGDDTINPPEASAVGFAMRGMTKPGEALKAAGEALKNLPGLAADQRTALNQYISALAVNNLGFNVNPQSLITRATGQVLNSNLELLFQGVNLRSFPFTFDFAPRSNVEAKEVKDIIKILKQTMTPSNGGAGSTNSNVGLFISSPSVYQLTYKSGSGPHPFLNRFKPCALTDINLNYTGSGTYATYGDGTPVHIQMSLTFKEINPIYSEDYNIAQEGNEGVGY